MKRRSCIHWLHKRHKKYPDTCELCLVCSETCDKYDRAIRGRNRTGYGRKQTKGQTEVSICKAEKIIRQFKSGKTMQEIGYVLGITRERVRQILAKNGVDSSQGGYFLKRYLAEKRVQ